MKDTTTFLRENPTGHSEFFVQRAKAGSQRAWDVLYARYRTMLVAHVQSQIRGSSRRRLDGEDVLQDAFIKVFRQIHTFEYRGEGSFRAWLVQIVLRTLWSEARTRPEEQTLESNVRLADFPDPKGALAGGLDSPRALVLDALGQLGLEERDILIQRHMEDLSYEDIARILGRSRETARQLHLQAFARLQQIMKRD